MTQNRWIGPRIVGMTIVLLCFTQLYRAREGPDELTEPEIKASYVLNFARFTEWHGGQGAQAGPLEIGIIGKDPFGPAILDVLTRKSIGGRQVKVVVSKDISEVQNSHILFISSSEDDRVESIIAAVAHLRALTVGETVRFRAAGGIIRFYKEEGTIRLEVNRDALEKAPLRLSSRLLNVARVVASDGGPPRKNATGFK